MLPSRSDRRAWPAFLWVMVGLGILLYFIGLLNFVVLELVQPASLIFGYLGLAFSMAIGVDLLFMILIAVTEGLVSRFKGISVVYGSADAPPGTENVTI